MPRNTAARLPWTRTTMGSLNSKAATEATRVFVNRAIESNKVVVFSKTYCPYCTKAKVALNQFVRQDQYATFELDQMDNGSAIQGALAELTGGSTVPRVFVGGRFIGGGDDTAAKARNGELRKLLTDVGL